jgi:hypothetical protein
VETLGFFNGSVLLEKSGLPGEATGLGSSDDKPSFFAVLVNACFCFGRGPI